MRGFQHKDQVHKEAFSRLKLRLRLEQRNERFQILDFWI